MINCLAIDDEPLALRQIASYIEKVPYLHLVDKCHNAFDAIKVMEQGNIDVIFIDINMPDLNGLDFVRSLTKPPMIVFTTAYSEYAIEGYKVNATDYLLKPFGMDDFLRAANKVRAQYELRMKASQEHGDDSIFVKSEHRTIKIETYQIRYIEGMSEYLRIYLVGKDKPVIALLAMKKMEETLPASTFMRIHRSYIVNLKMIQEVNKSRVILVDGIDLPIGDIYRDTFFNYVETKMMKL